MLGGLPSSSAVLRQHQLLAQLKRRVRCWYQSIDAATPSIGERDKAAESPTSWAAAYEISHTTGLWRAIILNIENMGPSLGGSRHEAAGFHRPTRRRGG
jgi:hypothetical protein